MINKFSRRAASPYGYLGIVALLIAYGSLYPFDFSTAAPGAFLRLISEVSLSGSIGDALGNIGLFAPWGLIGIIVIAPRHGMVLAVVQTFAIGFVIAVSLQIAQVWVPTRTPALNDVVWNMVGCAVGFLLGHKFHALRQSLSGVSGLKQSMGFFLGAWIIWEWLPLVPSLDFQLVKDHLKDLLALGSISFNMVFERVAISLLFGDLLSRLFTPRQSLILLPILVTAIILGKLFLIDAQLSASIALGFLIGIVSWWVIYRFSAESRSATIVVMLLLSYTVQALEPFSLKDAPTSFVWLPFAGLLEGSMLTNIRSLGCNLLIFGSVLLLLRIAGSKIAVASVGLAFWVMTMELAQIFITTRSGAITDPLLVLIVGQLMGVLDFSVKGAVVENQLAHVAEKPVRGKRSKQSSFTVPQAVIHTTMAVVVIVIGLKILLKLPGIPYNVKELFRADGSVLALSVFALSLIWIGAGSVWLVRRLSHSRLPGITLFPLTLAVSLFSLALLWSGVTSESVDDIVGSANRFWFVTNEEAWGPFWRVTFLYLDVPEIIGFLETCVRYWALYTPLSIILALIYYVRNTPLGRPHEKTAKAGLALSAFLILWVCKAIAFDWSSTDNLNELIARDGEWGWGGGGYLYGLVFLFCLNAIFISDITINNTRNVLTVAFFSLAALPAGWWLINQGLEQNVEKYGVVFSGVQFLLGADRTNLLSQNALLARWCLAQGVGVLVVSLGLRLGKSIFPFFDGAKSEPEGAGMSLNKAVIHSSSKDELTDKKLIGKH